MIKRQAFTPLETIKLQDRDARSLMGFTLVEVIIVAAIIGILAIIGIPSFLKARIGANESAAQATLKTMSVALETYAIDHGGEYAPEDNTTNDDYLLDAPAYLNEAYCSQAKNGYSFSCNMDRGGYEITAAVSVCGRNGDNNYAVTTGGQVTSSACE